MSKNKHWGICHICGKFGELSFEHIPPYNALNKYPATVYNGNEILKRYYGEKHKYVSMQRGMGKYSLCQQCNNLTGSWYADIYCDYAKSVAYQLHEMAPLKHGDVIDFTFKDIPILFFAKQIISMFCSLIPYEEVQRLAFDEFLLNKDSNSINTSLFDLRMFLAPIKTGQLSTGIVQAFLKNSNNGISVASIVDLAAYPFGFILNLTPDIKISHGVSINEFLHITPNEVFDIKIPLVYLERYNEDVPIPLAFKSLPTQNDDNK